MEVVRAAAQGQVEILFVPLGRECRGCLAPDGSVTVHAGSGPGDEDLFDLAAAQTLLHGGTVYAVGAEEIPGGGPAAAIFWLPGARKAR